MKLPRTSYAYKSSGFFRLTSIHALAKLIQIRVGAFQRESQLHTKYFLGQTPKSNGEIRLTETPYGELRRLHERVLTLFSRLEPPDYLHSGIKGRSYVTNANAHLRNERFYKLDIKKFFPNTTRTHIRNFFSSSMECADDIAAILSKLLTYDGHLPTGSPLSTLMSFYVHKPMFDEIYRLAKAHGITMTLYVDDITFSGSAIPKSFELAAQRVIRAEKLRFHKEKWLNTQQGAEVTGVILKHGAMRWPQRKHLAAYNKNKELRASSEVETRRELLQSLISRMGQGSQIEPELGVRKRAIIAAKPNILRG